MATFDLPLRDNGTGTFDAELTAGPPVYSVEWARAGNVIDIATVDGTFPDGFLISCWTRRVEAAGTVAVPFSFGNMINFEVIGPATTADYTWNVYLLTGNCASTNGISANYNANAMLGAIRPGSTIFVGDYAYYATEYRTAAEALGWVWVGWYVKVLSDRFIIHQYLKFGGGGGIISAGNSEILFSDARDTTGWTAQEKANWIPQNVTSVRIGYANGFMSQVRVDPFTTDPLAYHADMLAIAARTRPASASWLTVPSVWETGAAVIADAGPNSLTVTPAVGCTLYQGMVLDTHRANDGTNATKFTQLQAQTDCVLTTNSGLTVTAWVRLTPGGSNGNAMLSIAGGSDPLTDIALIEAATGEIKLGDWDAYYTNSLFVSGWFGIAVIYNGDGTMTLHVTQDGTTWLGSITKNRYAVTSSRLFVGAWSGNNAFDGNIQHVKLFAETQTPTQAMAELQSAAPVRTAWGWWPLYYDTSRDAISVDRSNNGHQLDGLLQLVTAPTDSKTTAPIVSAAVTVSSYAELVSPEALATGSLGVLNSGTAAIEASPPGASGALGVLVALVGSVRSEYAVASGAAGVEVTSTGGATAEPAIAAGAGGALVGITGQGAATAEQTIAAGQFAFQVGSQGEGTVSQWYATATGGVAVSGAGAAFTAADVAAGSLGAAISSTGAAQVAIGSAAGTFNFSVTSSAALLGTPGIAVGTSSFAVGSSGQALAVVGTFSGTGSFAVGSTGAAVGAQASAYATLGAAIGSAGSARAAEVQASGNLALFVGLTFSGAATAAEWVASASGGQSIGSAAAVTATPTGVAGSLTSTVGGVGSAHTQPSYAGGGLTLSVSSTAAAYGAPGISSGLASFAVGSAGQGNANAGLAAGVSSLSVGSVGAAQYPGTIAAASLGAAIGSTGSGRFAEEIAAGQLGLFNGLVFSGTAVASPCFAAGTAALSTGSAGAASATPDRAAGTGGQSISSIGAARWYGTSSSGALEASISGSGALRSSPSSAAGSLGALISCAGTLVRAETRAAGIGGQVVGSSGALQSTLPTVTATGQLSIGSTGAAKVSPWVVVGSGSSYVVINAQGAAIASSGLAAGLGLSSYPISTPIPVAFASGVASGYASFSVDSHGLAEAAETFTRGFIRFITREVIPTKYLSVPGPGTAYATTRTPPTTLLHAETPNSAEAQR